jgi:hypothetical protein
MTSQLAALMEKMRSVESEIESELAKRREELRFGFENSRVVFEEEALRIHRAIKTRASRYLLQANPLVVLTAPVIYSLLIPIMLLDIFVIVYQLICFPVYKSRKSDVGITSSSIAITSLISISLKKSIAPIAPMPMA